MTTATLAAATRIGRHADTAVAPACRSADDEEARVLARARTGDEAAFAWLLSRYRPLVLRLAAHVLRCGGASGEAEDAAQEGFIRAFQNLPAFRGGNGGNDDANSFRAYLCRITLRVCLDRRRRASWRAEVPADDAPPAATPDAADATNARLLVEQLLDALTPPLRAALVLREIEGLSYEEVARVLAVPVGTVRSRLSAARAQFRVLWLRVEQETNHV